MTKTELIAMLCDETGMTAKDSGAAVNATLDIISRTLAKGQGVTLTGFGTFEVHRRSARKGRNPRTGAELRIAAHKTPVFRAGRLLKKAVAK